MKVNVSPDVLSSFRRRALRRYPKEYMETIWGQVKGGEGYIYAFHPIEHKSDNESIEYEPVEIEEQRDEEAPLEKMILLGTIHTHPDGSIVPSQPDCETASRRGKTSMTRKRKYQFGVRQPHPDLRNLPSIRTPTDVGVKHQYQQL